MSELSKAVFLSYASEDGEAGKRICEALRAAGVEVWFDQNELVGGDAWDAKIRKQIADCALFVPMVSAATQARHEGYFRLEWKLAAQRTHMMSGVRAFLLPVVIDGTRDADAHVPEEFRAVQWTRLRQSAGGGQGLARPPASSGGQARPENDERALTAFCARVKKLLGGEGALVSDRRSEMGETINAGQRPALLRKQFSRPWLVPALLVGTVAAVALALWQPWHGEERSPLPTATTIAPPALSQPNGLSEARKLVAHAHEILEEGDVSNHETLLLAEELLKKAQALDSTDGEVWAAEAQLSRMMFIVGIDRSRTRRELLKQQAERAITLSPKSIEAEVAYAGFLSQTGQGAAEAVRRLEPLTRQYPSHRAIFEVLGLAYSTAGDPEAAATAFDRANALPGGDANALAQKGTQMIWHGRYAEAEQAVAQSLAVKETGRADVFSVLLKLCWRGDLDGAAAAVERWPAWLKLEPRGAIMASQVWLWRHEPEKAIAVLKPVASETWSDTLFTGPKSVLLALAYEMAGQTQAAHAEWENARIVAERQIAEDSTNRGALVYKACALVRLGDSPAAEKILREVEQSKDLRSEFWSCAAPSALLRVMLDHGVEVTVKFDTELRSTRIEQAYPSPRAALRLNPVFDPIRAMPEFQKWMAAAPAPTMKTADATPDTAKADDKSVAVLAFADLSAAHDSEYFSDGISEELINALGKVPGLKVPARTSSFYFKGKSVPVPEIAKQLGVAYVIEGSVQRAGDKVKILARLSKAADGFQVWTDSFLRDAKDVFAVEEEIAGLIAKSLSLKLGVSSAVLTASVNPQAFEFYVQARQAWNLRTPAGLDRAEDLLNRALTFEPNFARAHAALADVWSSRGQEDGSVSAFNQRNAPESVRIIAKAEEALALDPTLAEAHASLGLALVLTWNFKDGERECRQAVALNPNYASAHQWLGRMLACDGRMDEGLSELKLAAQLDPLSSRILDNYGRALVYAGRFNEALAVVDRALELRPDSVAALFVKAGILVRRGQSGEALTLAREIPLGNVLSQAYKSIIFAQAGARDEAETLLSQIDFSKSGIIKAQVLLELRRREEAAAALDAAWARTISRDDWLFDPVFDPIRDHPRWQNFLATLGLTEAHARAQAWRKAHPPETPVAK